MADKFLRIGGRYVDEDGNGKAKAIALNEQGELMINTASRKVDHSNIQIPSLFYSFGETMYGGGNADDSRTSIKPFKCDDLNTVMIRIENHSNVELERTSQLLLYNTTKSGSFPIFVIDVPVVNPESTMIIRISDAILDLEGIAVSVPKLSSFGVAYRMVGIKENASISVSIWGAD